MKKTIIAMALMVSACAWSVELVDLVTNAEIIEINVASYSNDQDKIFYVVVAGGEGKCANKKIIFPLQKADLFFNMMHQTALTAYANGSKKVTIGTTKNNYSCAKASYIKISK